MATNSGNKISRFLAERFTPEWKLLSETEAFLSYTPDFPVYENQFMEWRRKLQQRTTADTELVTIRSEIVALRKELRLNGYDLSLGLQRLQLQGFRNDDALADGFRRVVLCFCDPQLYFQTGSDNHITIAEMLMDSLTRKHLLHDSEMHYLWYLRTSKGLILSGSATERPTDFERLEARAHTNPVKLLSALNGLS